MEGFEKFSIIAFGVILGYWIIYQVVNSIKIEKNEKIDIFYKKYLKYRGIVLFNIFKYFILSLSILLFYIGFYESCFYTFLLYMFCTNWAFEPIINFKK